MKYRHTHKNYIWPSNINSWLHHWAWKRQIVKASNDLLFHSRLQPLSLSLYLSLSLSLSFSLSLSLPLPLKDFPLSIFIFFKLTFSLVSELPSNYTKKGLN